MIPSIFLTTVLVACFLSSYKAKAAGDNTVMSEQHPGDAGSGYPEVAVGVILSPAAVGRAVGRAVSGSVLDHTADILAGSSVLVGVESGRTRCARNPSSRGCIEVDTNRGRVRVGTGDGQTTIYPRSSRNNNRGSVSSRSSRSNNRGNHNSRRNGSRKFGRR